MGMAYFQAGANIEVDGKTLTLLRKIDDHIWQAEEQRTKRIREFQFTELQELIADQRLVFPQLSDGSQPGSNGKTGRFFNDVSDDMYERAKVRRSYVVSILGLPSISTSIAPVVHKVWQRLKQPKSPPHARTVLRWRRRYLRAGMDIYALVELRKRKGNRKSRYPEEVLKIVDDAIDKKYLTQERGTIQDVLEDAQIEVIQENALRPKADQLPLPTLRLVARLINKIPSAERHIARYGRDSAAQAFRGVLGHKTELSPLARVEIDHTKLDLFVIDEDTGAPLGRPYLTACIDVFSRCVLGIYLGFEPPSYLTVSRCLRHALLPKANLKKDFPEIKNDWLAYGVMQTLVMDNGPEFHSKSLEKACYSLGIEPEYTPRRMAWFKGKIERWQGTLNRAIAHSSPGTTFANIFEKEDYDPVKHAVLTLSNVRKIVNIWIVDYYHQRPHRSLAVPPIEMWVSNIVQDGIPVPHDPSKLDAILGRAEKRRLTHKGIEFDKLFYNSTELVELRRRHGAVLDVEIRVDDGDLGEIVVISPDGIQMFTVRALHYKYAKGISRWQHHIYQRYAEKMLDKHDPWSWLEAKVKIADIIDEDLTHKRRRSRSKVGRFKDSRGPSYDDPLDVTAKSISVESSHTSTTSNRTGGKRTSFVSNKTPTSTSLGNKKFTAIRRERRGADSICGDAKE